MGDGPPVRYRGMLVSPHYDAWTDRGLKPGFGDDLFRVDGIKAWSDGPNQAGTGYQREPYLETNSCGSLNYSPEDLTEVVAKAHRDGWQIGVHANGDAVTVDVAWQCRADDITGSIEVGKYADLAILEDDPTTVDPTSIAQIPVSETRLGGQVRHTSSS